MKMLMFDFRESEKEYFAKKFPKDFEIEFFEESLTENTTLTDEQNETLKNLRNNIRTSLEK